MSQGMLANGQNFGVGHDVIRWPIVTSVLPMIYYRV